MVALQIRDVPDEVRDILTDRAREQGRSLQSYLLELVKEEAARADNLRILRRFEGRTDGSDDGMAGILRDRDADRAGRNTALGGASAVHPGDAS